MRVSWSGHSALITLIRQAEMLGGGGGSEGVGEGDFFFPQNLEESLHKSGYDHKRRNIWCILNLF